MKRASEVPPEVESSGSLPVTSFTVFATSSVNGLGVVTNTSAFDDCHSNAKRDLPPAAATARRSISALSEDERVADRCSGC